MSPGAGGTSVTGVRTRVADVLLAVALTAVACVDVNTGTTRSVPLALAATVVAGGTLAVHRRLPWLPAFAWLALNLGLGASVPADQQFPPQWAVFGVLVAVYLLASKVDGRWVWVTAVATLGLMVAGHVVTPEGEVDDVWPLVLRDTSLREADGHEPLPDAAGIPALVEQVRRTGRDVRLTEYDVPPDLPAGVALAAHRLVQECLTNALRHGAGPVDLAVATADTGLRITVANTIEHDGPASPGGGRGLAGMGERVRVLGGTLSAGPRDGRWYVDATLPVRA
jgi:hypothetical protein